MKVSWAIIRFPQDPSGYHAVAETDGDVTVSIDGRVFVALREILILEFASVVSRWLATVRTGTVGDFYYASMDEEEEPLLALTPTKAGEYALSSCRSEEKPRSLTVEEVRNAFADFLLGLEAALRNNHNFAIERVFETTTGR